MEERDIAIQIEGLKKRYRLGVIGGGTLQGDIQSWWARKRGKEDPNSVVGSKQHERNATFMALDGIDLTVYKGERLGIIGHNGAGKSTLLKLLSRVTAPTEGRICIDGRIASMLEVGTGFNPELTGRENIYLNGAILGMTKEEVDTKMEEIIDFSECRQFIDTPVKRYSSGMYVKLAFAVAAHLDSEILVMDEVLAVGDMKFQQKCLGKMSDVSQTEGRTVLYVSHNMNTIRQLCDRCIVLDHGQIVFNGDVEKAIEIYINNNSAEMGVDIDFSNAKRMKHLPTDLFVRINHICLLDKEEPVYRFGESIKFSIELCARKGKITPSMRLQIRSEDDSPIGASYIHNIGEINEHESVVYSFELHAEKLVPGKYKIMLVLYKVNQFGAYEDVDALWPAFVFEIVDDKNELKINWRNNAWGRVYFGELSRID